MAPLTFVQLILAPPISCAALTPVTLPSSSSSVMVSVMSEPVLLTHFVSAGRLASESVAVALARSLESFCAVSVPVAVVDPAGMVIVGLARS